MFGDDEREAAEHDGNVMIPAGPATSLIVVEAEFAFQVFVRTLCSITLFEPSDEPASTDAIGQVGQVELARRGLPVEPLDDEPERVAIAAITHWVVVR